MQSRFERLQFNKQGDYLTTYMCHLVAFDAYFKGIQIQEKLLVSSFYVGLTRESDSVVVTQNL